MLSTMHEMTDPTRIAKLLRLVTCRLGSICGRKFFVANGADFVFHAVESVAGE